MQGEYINRELLSLGRTEFLKGCPMCEHSDSELERELRTFAQLLFDIYLAKRVGRETQPLRPDVDKEERSSTLKERSKQ